MCAFLVPPINYSANNVNAQVNVIGWRTLTDDTWQTIKYNDEMCQVSIHTEGLGFGTSWSLQNANILGDMKNTLKPKIPVISRSYATSPNFLAIREDGGLYKKSDTGSSNTSGAYCTLLWRYK